MAKLNKKSNLPVKRKSAERETALQNRRTGQGAAEGAADDTEARAIALRAENPANESAASAAGRKPRTYRRKPVGIGAALRRRGFDEHTIADHYVTVAERLKGKSDKSGSVEKLLVDILKECSKYIEPSKPADRTGDRTGQAPVHIHLVHNVLRPGRATHETPADQLIDLPLKTDTDVNSGDGAEAAAASGRASESHDDQQSESSRG